MVRPMVHSEKHIVQFSLANVVGGALSTLILSNVVPVADKNIPSEIEEGSTIKAIYIEMWVTGDDSVQGSGIFTVEKLISGPTAMTAAESASLNTYSNKKNILKMHMGLTNPNTGVATPIFREWIAIPKGKQRQGLDDFLVLNMHGQSDGITLCGFALYKEYK